MLRAVTPTLLTLLSGCPFIFEEPDLSHLDDGDASTATATETGTAPTGGTPTPPEPTTKPEPEPEPEPIAPVVVDFEIDSYLDRLEAKIVVTEGDAPLLGGTATFSDGVTDYVLDIPDDFAEWDSTSTSTATLNPFVLFPCDGLEQTWTVTLSDSAQVESDKESFRIDVHGSGVLPEVAGLTVVNPNSEEWTACLQFDDEDPLADPEDLLFVADYGGSHNFTFGWIGNHDMDITLTDEAGVDLEKAWTITTAWEQFNHTLDAGETYSLHGRMAIPQAGTNPPYIGQVFVRLR